VAAFVEATVGWNNALCGALLIAPPSVAAKVPQLDREVDRLVDLAAARTWTRTEFRQERARLGRMVAEYLKLARSLAGLPDIELPSIWTWDPANDRLAILAAVPGKARFDLLQLQPQPPATVLIANITGIGTPPRALACRARLERATVLQSVGLCVHIMCVDLHLRALMRFREAPCFAMATTAKLGRWHHGRWRAT
jgi:hypothetical protein